SSSLICGPQGLMGGSEDLLETTWPWSDLTARPCLASAASERHFSPGSPEETPLHKMLFLPAAALCCLCSALVAMAAELIQEDLTLTRRVGQNVSFSCGRTDQCSGSYVYSGLFLLMSGAPPLTIQPHLQHDEHSTSAHLSRLMAEAEFQAQKGVISFQWEGGVRDLRRPTWRRLNPSGGRRRLRRQNSNSGPPAAGDLHRGWRRIRLNLAWSPLAGHLQRRSEGGTLGRQWLGAELPLGGWTDSSGRPADPREAEAGELNPREADGGRQAGLEPSGGRMAQAELLGRPTANLLWQPGKRRIRRDLGGGRRRKQNLREARRSAEAEPSGG
ncbi:hypothetical protein L3Q82_021072, partial [Scortum barcoo]